MRTASSLVHPCTVLSLLVWLVVLGAGIGAASAESRCVNTGHHTERSGTFRAAPEGELYAASENCVWNIAPEPLGPSECVEVHIVELDVDEDWDYFYVEGEHTDYALSSWIVDRTLPAQSRALELRFVSDVDPWSELGVVGEWRVVPCAPSSVPPPTCVGVGVHTARGGDVRPMRNDTALLSALDCEWTLRPQLHEGECVVFSVMEFLDGYRSDFVTLTLASGGESLVVHDRILGPTPLIAARDEIRVHLRTAPENIFLEEIAPFAGRYDVAPCSSVLHVLPLQPGEENVMLLSGESGVVPVEARFREGMRFVINTTALQHDDMCVELSNLDVPSGLSRVWSKWTGADGLQAHFFSDGAQFVGPLHLTGNGAFYQAFLPAYCDYRVVACPGQTAMMHAARDVCAAFRALSDVPAVQTQGHLSPLCCGDYEVGNGATVSIMCRTVSPTTLLFKSVAGKLAQRVLDIYMPLNILHRLRLEYTDSVHVELGPQSSVQSIQLRSIGSVHLDTRQGNLTFLRIDSSTLASMYMSSSLRWLSVSRSHVPLPLPWDLLDRLEVLQWKESGSLGQVVWPRSLQQLALRQSDLRVMPTHHGLKSLACFDCIHLHKLGNLPDTLEILKLSGSRMEGGFELPPLPSTLNVLHLSDVGMQGTIHEFPTPCNIQVLLLAGNDLTSIDVSHCHELSELDVSDNPQLEHVGELVPVLSTLLISSTSLPQPDPMPMWLHHFEARNMHHWSRPIDMPNDSGTFVVSGSPVGRIVMRGLPIFLSTLEAEDCALTEFPFPATTTEEAWAVAYSSRINLAHNRIREVPRGALGPHLLNLDLSHNLLERIDVSQSPDHPRLFLDVSHNRLVDAGPSISAQVVDLSHNHLTSLPMMVYAHSLDASHNELNVAALPMSFRVISSAAYILGLHHDRDYGSLLDLSHNNLTSLADTMAWERVDVLRVSNNRLAAMDIPVTALSELDVSHNALTNTEDVVLHLGPDAVLLNAGHNALHRGDAFVDLPRSLHTLRIDHNAFSGALPSLAHLPKLATVDLHHSGFGVNADMCDDVTSHECIGPALTAVDYRVHDNERMECPLFALAHNTDVLVDMDATEYATKAVCRCIFGYYGVDGHCERCPANALCSGEYVVPERGYWNHMLRERRTTHADAVMQRCTSYTTSVTCSPDNVLTAVVEAFDRDTVDSLPRCSPGHTGRMCAACKDDYFQWGDRCNKCPNAAGVFFLLAGSFVIIVAAVVYAYKVKPGTNASLKVLVFFTQTIQLARSTGVQMDGRVANVLDFFSGFMIELPGIECMWRGYGLTEDTYAAMTMPLWACAVVMAVYAMGRISVSNVAEWWDRNVGALLLLNFMLFLRVAASVMAPLRCEDDPVIGHSYFAASPNHVCDNSLIGVSAAMVAVYVIGVPAALAVVMYRHRSSLDDDRVAARFRFLYSSYRPRYWYWEGIITVRKLGVLTIMAAAPRSSVAVPLCMFLLLVLSAVLQDRVRPFAEARDNAMEYTSLWTLAVLFVLLTASTVPGVHMPLWVGVLVALLQFAFVSGVLGIMLMRHRDQAFGLGKQLPSFLRGTASFVQRAETSDRDALLGGAGGHEDE